MRATCSTKRDDLRGMKKSVNHKHSNRVLPQNETFKEMKSLQCHNSSSTTSISKYDEIGQRSSTHYHTSVNYDNMRSANFDGNDQKSCYG